MRRLLLAGLFSAVVCPAGLAPDRYRSGMEALDQGRYAEAEKSFQIALRESAGESAGTRASIRIGLGRTSLVKFQFDQAERQCRIAIAMLEAEGPRDGPAIAEAWQSLGAKHWFLKEYDQAERSLDRALQCAGDTEPGQIARASILCSLGLIKEAKGRLKAAEEAYRTAIGVFQRVKPEEAAVALCYLADLRLKERSNSEAEGLFRQAIPLEEARKRKQPLLAILLSGLAKSLVAQNRKQEALEASRKGYQLAEEVLGGHPTLAAFLLDHASILRKAGLGSEAHVFDRRAKQILADYPPFVAMTIQAPKP